MKFLLYWEFNPEEREKVERHNLKNMEERKSEEKYGKTIFPGHTYEHGKGITIIEIDNPKQLASRVQLALPYLKMKFVPLIGTEIMRKTRAEVKKL